MTKSILITGGIGSGKSTVSKILSNLGYFVFDADYFARDVLFYPDIEARIKSIFGSNIYIEKGKLNRELVRKMIYDEPNLKKQLELVLHPAIEQELNFKSQMLNKISSNYWMFYEASLILENNKKNKFDFCLVVTAKHDTKIERLTQSRALNADELNKIMNTQMPDEEKIKHADFVIDNSSNLQELEASVFNFIQFLYRKFTPSPF